MRKRLLKLVAVMSLLIGGAAAVVNGTTFAADTASVNMLLPKELNLSDVLTPVFDAIDGNKLYDAAPQVVQVGGAENGWDKKLLNGGKVWFQIDASGEKRWVQLANPEFEESYYSYLVLSGEENIYGERSASARSLGTISPQVVRAVYIDGTSFLIETWLGYKWIHPKHAVISGVRYDGQSSSGLWTHLQTVTPMFAVPDAGSPVAGYLSPQVVVSKITLNNDWLYIDTWEGKRWIHTKVGFPADLRTEERSLTLTGTTNVYEHPDKQARVAGILGPQVVSVYEHGGGWHRIRSEWLGDGWIYQIDAYADPDAYVPPSDVIPAQVIAEWKSQQGVAGTGWRNYPFDLTSFVMNGDVINPGQTFSFGKPVNIRAAVKNVSPDTLTLQPSNTFEIEIVQQSHNNGGTQSKLVWSGKLPALDAKLSSGGSSELVFAWDQKDADGKQVPFGMYNVRLKLPMSLDYTIAGKEQPERQDARPAMLTSFPLRIGAP